LWYNYYRKIKGELLFMAFTEKGLTAIKTIIASYKEGEKFCAKEVGCAGATLSAVYKDGYLTRYNTSPVTYSYTKEQYEKILSDLPKTFAPYTEQEFLREIKMTYEELVEYCNNKYGRVTGSYFCTPEMKSQNSKITRGNEGLIVHHVKEDRAIMLSNKIYAIMQPWEWQCGENLVYCNIFEHLLLHMKITDSLDFIRCITEKVVPGWGGVVNYILPDLVKSFYGVDNYLGVSRKCFQDYVITWLKNICATDMAIIFRRIADPRFPSKWEEPELWLTVNSEEEFVEKTTNAKILRKQQEEARQKEEEARREKEKAEKEHLFRTSKIRKNKDGTIFENYEAVLKKYGRGQQNEQSLRSAIENKTKWHKSTWQYVD
jgi:hypothetical protein